MTGKKTCYLHIGSPKTGTTSIQLALSRARARLAENGFCYPGDRPSHVSLAVCALDDRHRWPSQFKKRRDSDVSAKAFRHACIEAVTDALRAAGGATVILSSEALSHLDRQACAVLKDLLAPLVDDIKIVCYIRHPLAHRQSSVQQQLRTGLATGEAIAGRPSFFRPSGLENTFIPVFGVDAMVVRAFDRAALVNGDVVDDFCQVVGIPPELAAAIDRRQANRSLSMEAAMIAEAVSVELPRLKDGLWNDERSRTLAIQLARISGRTFALPPDSAAAFADIVAAEVAYVRDRFGIDLQPPAEAPSEKPLWGRQTLRDIGLLINDMSTRIVELNQQNALLTAELLLARGKPRAALDRLTATTKRAVARPQHIVLLARIRHALGETDAALALLRDGRERFPDHRRLHELLAEMERSAG